MKVTVDLGVRVTKEKGIFFFGIEELNDALRAGKRVVAFEPVGAFFQTLMENGQNSQHVLSGFSIKAVVDD